MIVMINGISKDPSDENHLMANIFVSIDVTKPLTHIHIFPNHIYMHSHWCNEFHLAYFGFWLFRVCEFTLNDFSAFFGQSLLFSLLVECISDLGDENLANFFKASSMHNDQ